VRTTQGAAEVERERGHVVAEHDLVRARVQQIRHCFARTRDDRVGLAARRVLPVRVRVVVEKVVGHRLGHCARDLRSARRVEVGDRFSVVAAC
jgi:hypothetical protein